MELNKDWFLRGINSSLREPLILPAYPACYHEDKHRQMSKRYRCRREYGCEGEKFNKSLGIFMLAAATPQNN